MARTRVQRVIRNEVEPISKDEVGQDEGDAREDVGAQVEVRRLGGGGAHEGGGYERGSGKRCPQEENKQGGQPSARTWVANSE